MTGVMKNAVDDGYNIYVNTFATFAGAVDRL